MQVKDGQRVRITIKSGQRVPGIVVGDMREAMETHFVQKTQTEATFLVKRADVITLHTKQDGTTFHKFAEETVQYGYAIYMYPRSEPVVGLDFDANGNQITTDDLLTKAEDNRAEYLTNNFVPRGLTAAEDL